MSGYKSTLFNSAISLLAPHKNNFMLSDLSIDFLTDLISKHFEKMF